MIRTIDKENGTVLYLSVQPKASREAVKETDLGLKVWLTVAPESGKANKRLLKVLSKPLGLPQTALEIRYGGTSKKKGVYVPGLSGKQVVEKLMQYVDSSRNDE